MYITYVILCSIVVIFVGVLHYYVIEHTESSLSAIKIKLSLSFVKRKNGKYRIRTYDLNVFEI